MQRRTDQQDAGRLQLERLVHQIGDELDVAAMVGIGMRLGGGERFPQGRDKHGPGLAFQHGLLHPRRMSVRHLGREAGGAGHPGNAPPDDLRVGGRRKQERKAQFREKGLKERVIFMEGQHTGIADDAPRARLALRLIGGHEQAFALREPDPAGPRPPKSAAPRSVRTVRHKTGADALQPISC